MNDLQHIFALDFAYLETFTTRTHTNWGILFCNENNPLYFDANHAHISEFSTEPQSIIHEVVKFYQSKGIIPRFYIYNLDKQKEFISLLKINKFRFEELITPVQLWNKKIFEKAAPENMTIELVTEKNYVEALEIECSIKEFGGKEVREKAFEQEFKHSKYNHYLLRYNDIACATACLFINEQQARMESVATLKDYRGKGFIGFLIQHIQKEVANMGLENLWVFPINEKIGKVYQKYGFTTVEKIKMGHAYLEGRSIHEIQE
ncbi:GNAT family N-acetyltransferase [Bacillus aquiflavi]|uniref:GNAT family N-acetyltransferase n=1 Tax=Bacillus aquiflavi TaxID=2672567 RepID=A0A6B3VYD1_9BACI|nr:GNAT family N-acetyltransferase [Bacillus aquiflavi]MBA4535979.1 GNAT family N-acetyltransferase [Bacillus aquiflavi]NEY80354.1 GNAT family N-acetyltransferase [Bacillus aquiflavi]